MTFIFSVTAGVLFAAAVYLLLGRELKEICMGIFLLSHAANLAIITAGRAPAGTFPPVLGEGPAVERLVDPLPQALVLTAIVIGFAVQAFLVTLVVVTWRSTNTLEISELAQVPNDGNGGHAARPNATADAPEARSSS